MRRWHPDARELEEAEEEAGTADHRQEMFDRVVKESHMLDADRDTEHTPSMK